MVFFTCNACGESVKKVQVEKHVAICRNCECLSCIDCGKDFWGDDYKNHVKCISEDQKYGGKGYEGKTHKGDIKQQAWIQKINELMKRPNVSPKVRELLEQISAFDNVPRKKAKFQNWMKNSLKVHNESILEQVWNIFSEASSNEPVSKGQDQQQLNQVANPRAEISTKLLSSKANDTTEEQAEVKKNKRERKEERQKKRKKEKKELKLENHQENSKSQKPKKRKTGQEAGVADSPEASGSAGKQSQRKRSKGLCAEEGGVDGDVDEEETKTGPGKRKRKHSEVEAESKKKKMKLPGHSEGGEPENHEAPAKGKFNWKGTIKAVLKQAPDNEIAIKKLRKKILAQYYAVTNEHHKSEEELLVIFNKKISKNPTFKLLKDKVKLLK
ncbi:cell growth-regulating nucleolar protein [Diceros bicornis minor]|uniref:Cell growth-regulating nucleolar protein n=1 Tax=Ceratotherium simum simum TaxID=73337 RepID=A0ABM0HRB0_CERSS|nr:PREDICTED: cell growth-regulating nucleolar protein [Ceratotherium simum simum]XP_058402703.1 cell growth-regulating nucleolar protein [Diceros bicornis minor]XP_058402704.1 cell growth-regulating nucleolar protein [Diceros bicornis minor]XP_058402705.1 cell growth-regulating nucleolar protein [Diceros bicornis minor]XP_058402706.1 cell growth-regulating nucleolar protein [Diceros bicornis minor]